MQEFSITEDAEGFQKQDTANTSLAEYDEKVANLMTKFFCKG